jgi:DNA-binding MarR family transcriptional regulator
MADKNKVVRLAAAAARPERKFTIEKAWTPALAKTKYVAVVRGFLHYYSTLKPFELTTGEAMFIVHLMDFKWGAAAPFPKYKTLAVRMGVSEKQVRRLAKSLEDKGYVVREARGGRRSNRFNLSTLFAALEARVESEANQPAPTARGRVAGAAAAQ